jgi:hypothetical protein
MVILGEFMVILGEFMIIASVQQRQKLTDPNRLADRKLE